MAPAQATAFGGPGYSPLILAETITAVLGRSGAEGIDVDQRHTFAFSDPIEIPASQRIRIYGSRVDSDGESGSGTRSAHLSRGDEDSASPRKSYDDANLDFARIRHVRANTAFPEVGDTTHDHDAASVRGDIKIWFTTKIDHGQIVGDGTVNAAHINSGTSADGEVLTSDGSGGASWEAASGGDGGSSAFLDLTDTPSAFGTAGQVAAVNAAGDGLIFADAGGGGGSAGDRIVLANAAGIPATVGPHEIALTESMTERYLLSFHLVTADVDTPDGLGYLLSDDIMALTAVADAPTTEANSLPLTSLNLSQANLASTAGNFLVWREADDALWFRSSRSAAFNVTITATPIGGGGSLTTSEQESLSNAKVLTSRVFNGTGNGIATLGAGTTWPTNSPNTFVVTATEYADIERIELVFRQNGKVGLPYIITKGVLDEIPAGAFMPNSPADSQTIRGVFYAGRIGPSHRNTNYWVINPRFDFMDERREASDNCILIQYGLNGTLFTGVFIRARQPSGGLIFQHAELFYWVDA